MLREACGCAPQLPEVDELYDSAGVHHPDRWLLLLPSPERTLGYLERVLAQSLDCLVARPRDDGLRYFAALVLYHEDMHGEALLYTRQTMGYPPPVLERPIEPAPAAGPCPGDVVIAGGRFPLGARREQGFLFDNEKWSHEVEVQPFAMARAPVTEAEFLAFVEDGGYRRRDLWSHEGRDWLEAASAEHPVYWRREGPGRWLQRRFDRWLPLRPHAPMLHVNWHEAQAYCQWAGRRLPTEAEWERAACGAAWRAEDKPRQPWGNEEPDRSRAHVDAMSLECAEVGAFPPGDSGDGCRQLVGNVWEWTASTFAPYPGFAADPYREYSEPWFGSRKVLRGGCFATRGRMLWNTLRNFFTPERRDVFAGFRTVALERP